MHAKHGAFYLVRANRWTLLSRDYHDALVEYARLTAAKRTGELETLIDDVLDYLRPTHAKTTMENYEIAARRMREAFAEFVPKQIRPHHVARWLDDWRSTPSMANLHLAFARNVFDRGVRWGRMESDPSRDLKPFPTHKRRRYITEPEWSAIRAQAGDTLRCLMDLAYLTGQRIGDVMKIRYADISERGVFVEQQKTKHREVIEMTADLDAAIRRARELHRSVKGMTLFHRRDGRPLAYGTVYDQWVKACVKAGVEDANIHDVRAATATDARAQGLDSQALLGHSTESSHRRYLRGVDVPVVRPVKARSS